MDRTFLTPHQPAISRPSQPLGDPLPPRLPPRIGSRSFLRVLAGLHETLGAREKLRQASVSRLTPAIIRLLIGHPDRTDRGPDAPQG